MEFFPELRRLENLIKKPNELLETKILAEVNSSGDKLPVYGLTIGSKDKSAPTFGLCAGVHGLEKIGTHVVMHFLECLLEQTKWDEELNKRLQSCRIVAIPMLNPHGVLRNKRSNPNGVDLMRNSPVEAEDKPIWILGGHYISNKLPYYRGRENTLEEESLALLNFFNDELFQSNFSMVLDIHSGFGAQDRLWYPYAKTTQAFPLLDKALEFKSLLEVSFPNHVYKIESQSESYTTHGDLWDYLFDQHYSLNKGNKIMIPWCLEMGSWIWVRKNPIQILRPFGLFNPLKPHRYRRILRRHFILLDFFFRSISSYKNWMGKK